PVPETAMANSEQPSTEKTIEPEEMEDRGPPLPLTCPECGGTLWEANEGLARYRCHVGHFYSTESLIEQQSENVEKALWAALRALKEKAALALRVARRAHGRGESETEGVFMDRYAATKQQADAIHELLLGQGLEKQLHSQA